MLGDQTEISASEPGQSSNGGVYRCMVYITPEEEGGFSAVAANLPGAASQGDTEEEALANITEALHGVLESYQEMGEKIPWLTTPRQKAQETTKSHWVVVHG